MRRKWKHRAKSFRRRGRYHSNPQIRSNKRRVAVVKMEASQVTRRHREALEEDTKSNRRGLRRREKRPKNKKLTYRKRSS